MTYEEFTYWLKGFIEIADDRPTKAQWMMIKENLILTLRGTPEMKIYFPEPKEKEDDQDIFKSKLEQQLMEGNITDD